MPTTVEPDPAAEVGQRAARRSRTRPTSPTEAAPSAAAVRRPVRRTPAAGAAARPTPATARSAQPADAPPRSGAARGRGACRSTPRPTRPSTTLERGSTPGSPRRTRAGRVAIDTETTSLDPMQAELVGVCLATAPGKAAYVPLGHRNGSGDLLGGGLLAGQIPLAEALDAAEAAARGPVGPQDRPEPQVRLARLLAATASSVAPYDDTMLISYALDGGKGGTAWTSCRERCSATSRSPSRRSPARGKQADHLRPGADRQGDRLCRRGCRRHAAAVDWR